MEENITFKNAGEPWTEKEEKQLNKLYNEDMLDIMEISKIHCRAPGGIISRLKMNQYISNRQSARGYSAYKNSNLYKQIVETNKDKYKKDLTEKSKQNINTTQINNELIQINKSHYIELHNNVKEIKNEIKNELKNEIKELKNTIKELVEMMKALYDFEDA